MSIRILAGFAAALVLPLAVLAGCSQKDSMGAPPRARDPIVVEPETSSLTVPVEADLANLAAALDRAVPRRLWQIDAPDQPCIASKRVDLGIATVKTPTIKCRIVGEVTRGAMKIGGEGQTIRLAMPLHAAVRAEDIGGVLKRETATADAMAHAVVHLRLAPDWSPQGRIDIRYDWQDSPHLDFLGQRIDFTEQAERKLAPVIARLERELPRELGRLKLREQVRQAWESGFTTLSLNRENPPVWMRVTPKRVQYGGYTLAGNRLRLRLGLVARTETFVGDRPADPKPTPLPAMEPLQGEAGKLAFFLPVIASYKELEPVLMKALVKRSARPFDVPGAGPVRARFERATLYGTTGGRVAVGILFSAQDVAGRIGRTRGTVWLTATPSNAANSRIVAFQGLAVSGTTDMTGGDLILRLMNAPGVADFIAASLTQNFEKDYAELLGKIDRAIASKREGAFAIRVTMGSTRTGRLRAFGQGLYLPVWAEGKAAVSVVQ